MKDNDKIRYSNFIEKLYNSPSSTPQDKERIVKLLLSEQEKKIITEEKVRNMILAELGKTTDTGAGKKPGGGYGLNQIKYIPPYYLSNFLFEYNQDPILKYTCHNIDSKDVIEGICQYCNSDRYDFEAHQKLIYDHYTSLQSRYKIDYKVKSLIFTYITGKNSKGNNEKWASIFEDSWGSDSIKKWAHNNPGLVPNPGLNIKRQFHYDGCPLSKKYLSPLSKKRVSGFDGLVLCFKSLFHIKRDNNLAEIISMVEETINSDYPNTVFLKENFHNEIELFTNVLSLKIAYEKIVKMCIESGGGKTIATSFYTNQNGDKCFAIKDQGSVYGKSVMDTIGRLGESTSDVIKSQINGMCDLYLESDFQDGKSYRINLWNGEEREAIEIEKVDGVKYVCVFKK